MADELTTRLGLPIYTSGAEQHPTREDFNDRMSVLDEQVVIKRVGALADRPLAGDLPAGVVWEQTDAPYDLWWNTGAEWLQFARIGHGGAGRGLSIGASGAEGTSARAARADHTHPLPLATPEQDGAMSRQDKDMLEKATPSSDSNTLALRDSNGRISVGPPGSNAHAANKRYVDQQRDTRAPSSHTHDASDITGTLATARIPNIPASQTTSGVFSTARIPTLPVSRIEGVLPMSQIPTSTTHEGNTIMARDSSGRTQVADPSSNLDAANKRYVDGATQDIREAAWDSGGGTLVRRGSNTRRIQVGDPRVGDDATTKNYVDQQRDTRAPSSHSHDAGDITGTLHPIRLPVATADDQGAMSRVDKRILDGATNLADPSTLMRRSSSGQVAVSHPTVRGSAANKGYVDDQVGTRAPSSHTHSAADTTSGVFSVSRLPEASNSQRGTLSAAHHRSLSEASWDGGPGTLVRRSGNNSRIQSGAPLASDDVTTKQYVDDTVADHYVLEVSAPGRDLNTLTSEGNYAFGPNDSSNTPESGAPGTCEVMPRDTSNVIQRVTLWSRQFRQYARSIGRDGSDATTWTQL